MDLLLDVSSEIGSVSATLLRPPESWLLYVLAHGAGAGMRHSFLESIAAQLSRLGVATLRYQFPYMEAGRKRTDQPAVAEATVAAAVSRAGELVPGLPVIAGGKSFGGRMTSGAAASGLLPGIVGLAFLGFPLHPPGQPGTSRAEHLSSVELPMLFLQGTRDQFARLDLISQVCDSLGARATLHLVEGGDHSFALPRSSGQGRDTVLRHLSETLAGWARAHLPGRVSA